MSPTRTLVAVTAVTAAALTTAGCGCTEAGCVGGVSIEVVPDALFEVGSWTLTVDGSDGFAYSCEYTVTDLPDDCDGSGDTCVVVDPSCPDMTWSRAEDGAIELLVMVQTGDPELEVTVLNERGEVFQELFEPEYETIAPNGERCDPVCTGAHVFVEVPLTP